MGPAPGAGKETAQALAGHPPPLNCCPVSRFPGPAADAHVAQLMGTGPDPAGQGTRGETCGQENKQRVVGGDLGPAPGHGAGDFSLQSQRSPVCPGSKFGFKY